MTTTLTMAGHLANAGAARPRVALGTTLAAAHATSQSAAAVGGYGTHQASPWTQGAIAKPATFVVFDRKNRPARHLSELSP